MINKQKIYGLLGLSAKAGKVVFGTEACIDLINKGKVKLIIVAEDSAERTINNFTELCEKNNIDIRVIGDKESMSKAIGQSNKVIVGIKDKNLSKAILKIIDGGDIIG